jgi:aspartyl-tRNA(Asn)/glutamyl-tRNA(Gln) amidotransferase subunit C
MAELSGEDIAHLGHLARLELTDEETVRFSGQLSKIVEYVEQLAQVDTKEIHDLFGVTGKQNVLAQDVPRSKTDPLEITREAGLKGAPSSDGEFILVKAVFENEAALDS